MNENSERLTFKNKSKVNTLVLFIYIIKRLNSWVILLHSQQETMG